VLIRRQGLKAPDRSCAKWPWAIRVRALGALAIEVDGEPHASTGKAQQRLLELLRVLAAAGRAGRTQQALEHGLWPDAESPKAALAVAVHRLRKLLGRDDAVIVRAGAVMLDPTVVWTDVDAFNHLCESVGKMDGETPAAVVERMADRLCSIYRGAVCQDDSDPWIVAVRARLCACFVTCATTLGDALEKHARWEAAGCLYRRVLEAEPLCETAYRGLMRCAHAQGDSAAAFSFYRFCRDTLSVILRREPCTQTRQLASDLGLLSQAGCEPLPLGATAPAAAWVSATTAPATRA
jgi:DNA-binding SARP family transcriptional activator